MNIFYSGCGGNYSGLGRALVIWGPTAFHWFSSPLRTLPWHVFSAQISGGSLCRSQFSLCSSCLFGVLPCSFEPPWLPWTTVCVSISQKDYLTLLEFPLLALSPGSCSGQSLGSPHLLSFSQGSQSCTACCPLSAECCFLCVWFSGCLRQEDKSGSWHTSMAVSGCLPLLWSQNFKGLCSS